MKKMLLFLFVAELFFVCSISAQNDQVTYDFLKKTIKYPVKANLRGKEIEKEVNYFYFRKPVTFKIDNINTLLYDVNIKGENIEMNSGTPDVFKLFFNTEKFAQVPKVSDATNIPDSQQEVKNKIDEFNAKVKLVLGALTSLEETKDIYDHIYLIAYTDGKSFYAVSKEMKKYIASVYGEDTLVCKADIISDFKDRLEIFTKGMEKALNIYSSLSAAQRDTVESEYQQITGLNKKVEKFNYEELFQKTAVLYEKTIDPNTFSYTTSPIIAEKDFINYSIEIKPKKDLKFTKPEREEKFEIPVFIKGGAKIDFSTGLFFAGKKINDQKYHTSSISNDTILKTIVKDEDRNVFSPSLGAMMNVSFRGPCFFHPAVSVGLGLSTSNISDAVYCLGLSGIIGNDERVIFSIGFMGKQVNDLKGRYNPGGTVRIADIKSDDDLVEKTFKTALFIGFTYNLTNKKKGQ